MTTNIALKQHNNAYSYRDQKSGMSLGGLISRCYQGCAPSGRSRERICFLAFSKPIGAPWLTAPSLIFKASDGLSPLAHVTSL